jgi:YidC/Oxa1 family membrane protein insertase
MVKPVLEGHNAKIRLATSAEARQRATQDLYAAIAKEHVNPLKSVLGLFVQAPVFMLFYFALKALTEKNIDHMDIGGALWFVDLTVPDPYYILSLLTAGTFILTIEVFI